MTATTSPAQVSGRAAASVAAARASRILLARQHFDGSWPDRAVAEVTPAAEALLVREFLGIATAQSSRAVAAQLRSGQRGDGSWAGGEPGPAADLSASVLAYLALRLAGDPPDAYHMAAGAGWIRDAGGIDAAGVMAQAWLATFGLTAWDNVPVPSPERACLAVRGMAGPGKRIAWSPVAVTGLAIVGALRPVRRLPVTLAELQAMPPGSAPPGRSADLKAATLGAARAAPRRAALQRCGRWLTDWQLAVTPPGGQRPVWPLSVLALDLLGYQVSHPAQAAGLAWLDAIDARPGSGTVLAPVAQTALAVEALRAAGLAAGHPALVAAGRWLIRHRVRGPAVRTGPRAEPMPCGWSFCPDGYPRPADTACVLAALSEIDLPSASDQPALRSAAAWLAAAQHRNGSWEGSATVTGCCVRALARQAALRQAGVALAIRRGVVWLLRAQLSVGGWPGQRGGGDLHATAVALPALVAAGVLPGKPPATRAVDWLLGRQNPDGGWHLGGLAGPPDGESDPTGTGCALTALLAAGGRQCQRGVEAAADWLTGTQLPDGSWAEPARSGGPAPQRRGRREDSAVPGTLVPLAALGRYAATADRAAG